MQLSVYFNDKDKTLYGEVTFSDQASDPVTPALVLQKAQHQINALGYGDVDINPQAVDRLCAAAHREEDLKLSLRTIIDGKAEVKVSSDKRQAALTLQKADGGREVDLESVSKCLSDAGVSDERVDWDAVNSALDRGQVSDLVIARAKSPLNGTDAVYTPLVASEVDRVPVVDEHGVADMMSAHVFVLVEPGDSLMRREPATTGEPGMDVTGATIAAMPGTDPGFKSDLQGAEFAEDDPDLLIASIKGHPLVYPDGVAVDPVLHVDNVDIHTGNIDFDGSLEVTGDVAPGVEVRVTGDVTVKGAVERAHIIAGNQVVIHGGVFGRQDIDEEAGMASELPDTHFDIEAGGDVEAGFLNQVAIQSYGDIRIKQYAAHSFLKAEGQVALGQDGGKGVLIGGLVMARTGAVIAQAGNDSYVPTTITLGVLHHLLKQQQQINQQITARQSELQQLQAIFNKIQKKDPVMLGKVSVDKTRRIANTIDAIKQSTGALQEELDRVTEAIASQQNVFLTITKRLCPNTRLSIQGIATRFSEEHSADTWRVKDEQLIAASEMKDE